MDIKILGWKAEGLRCPDMDVDLAKDGSLSHVSLIQMPNGTGKTTTLSLISACLTGVAEKWSEDEIAQYRRVDRSTDEGAFHLHLRIDEALVTFELNFDFLESACRYRTSSAEDRGVRDGWRPSPALRRYFNQAFIDLVVFDGELASRLLDKRFTQAEKAIDALCHLDFLEKFVPEVAGQIWKNAKMEGALDESQITSIKKRIEKTRIEFNEVSKQLESALTKREQKEQKKNELEADKQKELDKYEELKERYQEAEGTLKIAEGIRSDAVRHFSMRLLNPVLAFPSIADSLLEFKEGLDKARLPESSSKQFFEEIVEQPRCICGTEFNEEMRDHVRKRMGEYLSSETTAVLNVIKESVARYTSTPLEENQNFDSSLNHLVESHGEYYKAVHKATHARSEYSGPGAEEIGNIEQQIGGLTRDIEFAQHVIDKNEPRRSEFKEKLERLEDELAEAQNAKSLKKKVGVLTNICGDTVSLVRERVKSEMLEECNAMLPFVLADNPVQLSGIDGAIQLYQQEKASVGQTLAVGYVFLAKLFSHAAHSFPFVVDSPVGSLDNSVRGQIGSLIPSLDRQFIAFTISSERIGFVAGIEPAMKHPVRFVTIKRSDDDPNIASVIEGRDAFFAFHADQE